MRCHICNGFTNDACSICGNYTCSLCIYESVCRRCRTDYGYINFPKLNNIVNPVLLIAGILLVIVGFVLVTLAFINENVGIIIFPFVFEATDPIVIIPLILFIILPIIFMLIFMRDNVRFK